MFLSARVEQHTSTSTGLASITSLRLFVLLAFGSFWIYRYILRAAKYRVPSFKKSVMPTIPGSTDAFALGRSRIRETEWLQAANVCSLLQMASRAGCGQARIRSRASEETTFSLYRLL